MQKEKKKKIPVIWSQMNPENMSYAPVLDNQACQECSQSNASQFPLFWNFLPLSPK